MAAEVPVHRAPDPEYTPPFYGAFIFDPDGFKIEAVCRSEE